MAPSDGITLSLPGWVEYEVDDNERAAGAVKVWFDEAGRQLSLLQFDKPPDLPAPLSDLATLRARYRTEISGQNGALVSVDNVDLCGVPTLRIVVKVAQDPHGMTYVGSYIVPFETFSYVVRVICPEFGSTGMRDTVVFDKIGVLSQDGVAEGWFQDPYDAAFQAPVMRNRSDDEQWDGLFPDHPLTRARATLADVSMGCRISDEVRRCGRFTGPGIVS